MYLNTLHPADGAKKPRKRVGRGAGSGIGKTAGRGQKGQKSRSGGYHKVGFEGGQMPLQRRLPKRGFRSMTRKRVAEIRLHELNKIDATEVDLNVLKDQGVVSKDTIRAKVIFSGIIEKPVNLKGISATKGARAAIEQAGGSVDI